MEKKLDFSFFLSYSGKDIELAQLLIDRIENSGIKVLFDKNIINAGDNWSEKLSDSFNSADGILVLLTNNSISSNRVLDELEQALLLRSDQPNLKLVLPIMHGNISIPPIIQNIQAIFWEKDIDEVINKIQSAVQNFSELKIRPNKKSTSNSKNEKIENQDQSEINYWLLKLNPETWEIEELKEGLQTFFSPKYYGKLRPEFSLLDKITKGDKVLCFASGRYQSIVCEMVVTNPFSADDEQGAVIRMEVTSLVSPKIPLDNFRNLISNLIPRLERSSEPPELFFQLDEKTYNEVLILTSTIEQKQNRKYQPFYYTEGHHQKTIDQLDFENDIDSFASVIALKNVEPPLAIGLFGNWGSGKSFFMEKLEERIKKITNPDGIDKGQQNNSQYVKDVVHVKFNSWHYSDANLWASLITEIFDSLKIYAKNQNQESEITKLQRALRTTILERKDIDKKRNELEKSVEKLESDQSKKRSRLEDISGIKLLKRILSNKKIRNDLAELNNENIEKVIENKEKIDLYIEELQNTWNKTIFFFKEFLNIRGWRWAFVISIAVIVALGAPLLKYIFPNLWETFTWQIRTYSTLVAVFLTNIISTIKPYSKAIQEALTRLQSLKETMESREQAENPQLDAQQSELNQLQLSLVNLDDKIADIREDITEILSGRRLIQFIEEKTKDENYNKALGIISWVRKDFITLDKLLREQHIIPEEEKKEFFNPEDVQLKIDRIVLYIDDLDRCNEDIVVRVLEAIHLLLAFPLFVVVVGVDPRWLNNALSEKYRKLFGQSQNNDTKVGNDDINKPEFYASVPASSYDYLEKIFQIPFALKPINETGRKKLIKYLMRNEMATESIPNDLKDVPVTELKEEKNDVTTNLSNTGINEGIKLTDQPVIIHTTKERLVFTQPEMEYMQYLSPLFGNTPRTINRYINIYRIIRAHGNLDFTGDYSEVDYKPIMFILGVVVGHSVLAEELINMIKVSNEDNLFGEVFQRNNTGSKELNKAIGQFIADIQFIPIGNFKKNIELISRFSFRTLLQNS